MIAKLLWSKDGLVMAVETKDNLNILNTGSEKWIT